MVVFEGGFGRFEGVYSLIGNFFHSWSQNTSALRRGIVTVVVSFTVGLLNHIRLCR